jgi:hypothetical protein
MGGFEGPTEYWWMRISPEGRRTQVCDPRPIPSPGLPPVLPGPSALAQLLLPETAALAVGGATRSDLDPRLYYLAPGTISCCPRIIDVLILYFPYLLLVLLVSILILLGIVSSIPPSLASLFWSFHFAEDLGCVLKAKCRPARSDGAQGEIFTSASSGEVEASAGAMRVSPPPPPPPPPAGPTADAATDAAADDLPAVATTTSDSASVAVAANEEVSATSSLVTAAPASAVTPDVTPALEVVETSLQVTTTTSE